MMDSGASASAAIDHYRRTGTVLPGHQGTIARYIDETTSDND